MSGSEDDSEQKKWGQKRQQFDAVVSSARFNGAIDNLVNGTTDARAVTAILDELNSGQSQRGRYMAEILALKMESRRLVTVQYHKSVAEFLIEGARRIPWLTDGLASQMAVTLGSAADNLAYLDTVNAAVGNLLLDVTRPLKPDTRNYLRALTDKIDATRRMQDARGHLAIVPSVYPSAIPEQLARAKSNSPEPPPAAARSQQGSALEGAALGTAPLLVVEEHARDMTVELVGPGEPTQEQTREPSELVGAFTNAADLVAASGPGAIYPKRPELGPAVSSAASAPGERATPVVRDPETPTAPADPANVIPKGTPAIEQSFSSGKTAPGIGKAASGKAKPGVGAAAPAASGTASSDSSAARGLGAVPAARSALPTEGDTGGEDWDDLDEEDLKTDHLLNALGIPVRGTGHRTRGIPVWIMVVAAGTVIAGGIGVWLLTREGTLKGDAPIASASVASSAASPAASAKGAKKPREKKAPSAASVQAPVPPPPTPAAAPPAPLPPPPVAPSPPPAAKIKSTPIVRAPPAAAAPAPRPAVGAAPRPAVGAAPISKPPAAAAASSPKPPVTKTESPKQTTPKATTEAPVTEVPASPRTPTPSRTVDDIIAELRQVPNDSASIEAKAHEVSRIVSRSVRKDAEIILQRLIPEEVLAGTETVDTRALEPVRRVVALVLKKVALDKDDNRAALAIDSLGEWAKLRQHGAAAKLTLDQLAEEPVILSRPTRLRALERVQARLGISNVGE